MSTINDTSLINNIPYRCEVWRPENHFRSTNDMISSSQPEHPEFLIDVFVTYVIENDVVGDDSYDNSPSSSASNVASNTTSFVRYFRFAGQRHLFTESSNSWSTISNMLSQMLVPFHAQPLMIQKISTCAREIALRPDNIGRETIPLVVSLVVGQEPSGAFEEEEQEDEGEEVVPTAEAARARFTYLGLERVENIGEQYFGQINCVICLEEMLGELEIARLPCLHFYHKDCIVRWLGKSSLCPLCRFEMPLDYD